MRPTLMSLAAALALSACIAQPNPDADAPEPTLLPPPPTPEDRVPERARPFPPAPEPVPAVAPASCALTDEPAWTTPAQDRLYGPATVHSSPEGHLLLVTGDLGTRVLRASDGAPLGGAADLNGLDAQWGRRVTTQDNRLVVLDARDGGRLADLGPQSAQDDDLFAFSSAALSPDGDRALVLTCHERPSRDEGYAVLRVVDVEAAVERSVDLGARCGRSWMASARLLVRGDRAFVIGLEAGESVALNLVAGTVAARWRPPATPPSDDGRVPATDILAASLAPSGDTLWVVAGDGSLHQLDGDTLDPRADAEPVGATVANFDTFLPTVESPIAMAPGGDALLHLGPAGALQVRDAEGVHALQAPFAAPEGADEWAPHPETPMAAEWTERGLTVAFAGGVAHWPCAEHQVVDPGSFPSGVAPRLVGARVGVPVRVPVGSAGGFATTLHLSVDGVPVTQTTLGAPPVWTPNQAGEVELTAVVDDGLRRVELSALVQVEPSR
jgi:hypothetical protein